MRWIPTLAAVVVIAVFGVIIVMQKLELTRLGYDLGKAEKEHCRLSEDVRRLNAEISRVTSLEEVSRRVEDWHLPLRPPGKQAVEGKNKS